MTRSLRLQKAVLGLLAGGLLLAGVAGAASNFAADKPRLAPEAAFAPSSPAAEETAVLSGGCFWGLQGVFEHVRGVKHVTAGYAGGARATADYEKVSTGATGHAETVKIVFDPRQISFAQLLRIYFSVATDPTQRNQQYPDQGPQYRGEIFYTNAAQLEIARRYVAQLGAAHVYAAPIATRIDRYDGFYPAEGYHQDYLQRNPNAPYIATFDMPKLVALRRLFPSQWRAQALSY